MLDIFFFYKYILFFAIVPAAVVFFMLLALDISFSLYESRLEKQKRKKDLFSNKN